MVLLFTSAVVCNYLMYNAVVEIKVVITHHTHFNMVLDFAAKDTKI